MTPEEALSDLPEQDGGVIQVNRDPKAWVRVNDGTDGDFEVYARTDGFLQDRLFTTTEMDVLSKMSRYGWEYTESENALF